MSIEYWDATSTAGSGAMWTASAESTATQQTHSWIDRWEAVVDSNNAGTTSSMSIEQIRGARDLMVNIPPYTSPISVNFRYRHDFGIDSHKSDLLKYMMGEWEEQEDVNKKVHDIFKGLMKDFL